MQAKVDYRIITNPDLLGSWEVEFSIWEEDRCVLSAYLDDGFHDGEWHSVFASKLADKINTPHQTR